MATTTPTASPDQFDGKALLDALVAYRRGDFSVHLPNHWTGIAGKIADTFNAIADSTNSTVGEYERVAKVVGREGRVSERIQLPQTDGGWGRLVAASNTVLNDLAAPLGEMTRVIGLVAAGDLRQTVPLEAGGFKLQGQFLRTAEIVNNMVGQLNGFSSEVTRVAREVGTEGKLGGQAEVAGVSGTWKDLTDSVNGMASNLTAQVRNIAEVSTAIANGDLSKKITAEAKGEILELKNTVNVMVDQLSTFAAEVTRVAREVGTEGKLGGQAEVAGVLGTWKDLTDNVNGMASNLTNQVRNIAQVTTAVAQGDLSRKVTVDVRGEMLELKNTINIMVDQLSSFAAEVTRVAREVGTEGKLGGQAAVPGISGTWKDLTENVNGMAANLTDQVRNIAQVTTAVANGDLSKKIVAEAKGEILELKNTINIMVDQLSAFAAEVTRVAREVGTEGKLGGQAQVPGVSGTWKDLTENVNGMASNLTNQVRNIAEVSTAIANGDLSKKITAEAKGEVLELKNTVNVMVDQLSTFAAEVTRVAREVGTEGRLGGQAQVADVSGTWKDLTDNVNGMASNLTDQVRNIAQVTTAVANGDLSKKIVAEAKGEILELKNTINIMVDQLSSFAAEVTRVAREVGSEGKLGGQAQVPGISGTWKDLTDNVNGMAANLTNQVRNIAYVTTAVANGDLSKKIVAEAKGEILELKNTINTMVDQLSSFAAEVTRVAREVGTEGKLGGQAQVAGVSGTWKDLTDNVNGMASNLTNQVRNIAQVTTAVANGDLSKKITAEAKGEILELTNTINIMVDQLSSFAAEVTRVAREVGSEGKLGGQAAVPWISGTWKDLTDNVNGMASNLTAQVRNIADVSTAIANGDLSRKITADARGEILELKNTINVMVEQLRAFAGEVTRVAREVGTEGKLGGQAQVTGVSGTWKDLTDSVNGMATNLTNQVRNIAEVTTAVANGDLSKKITVDVRGEILLLKETVNTMVDQLRAFAAEVTRVAREVGTDGRLGGQAFVTGVSGTWKDLTDSVNGMAANLTDQVRNIAQVTTAVANGDLSKKIVAEAKGEILELKNTINIMVDQLSAFAAEVTRVAREVGTEGKLGGQGAVRGVSGTWKDLTDSVNGMATNLTNQVRGIAKVVTAVAKGDLRRKLTVEAKGEIAELSDTINDMIDTLALFSDQVTSVAREVGVEGRLGGQANVPGAAGTWKDLTDNVNQLAANLTGQVRAIAEVATAVTKGDLSRSVQVEAKGEVGELKNNINEMIGNLRETTRQNAEQDWLKTNLARFTRLLQGQRDLATVSKTVLAELAPLVNAQHGIFYMLEEGTGEPRLKMFANYGFKERKNLATEFKVGEGLVGQCAVEKQRILLTNVPGDYIQISSGLGEAKPFNIVVMPIVFEGSVRAVVELASFDRFSQTHLAFFDQLAESMGIVVNTIEAGMKTEGLLTKSQSLAQELQSQQEELQQTNEELEEKAKLLEEQKLEVERKNREVEQAKGALEEKAEQLALTSKYKSEFLSNMSHELRTPLNSLLILSQQLGENDGGGMTGKQVEYAKTIEGSGRDLLALINEILDLSKIESGTVTLEVEDVPLAKVREQINRTFEHVAMSKGLKFAVKAAADLPGTIRTDEKRLMQVLKNLLSNALKFTPKGSVSVSVAGAASGWSADHAALNAARRVIAFSVADTGIGIPADKHRIVFEAFQQADGSTSRKYGGTGLGLSISRELARLLGGELRLTRSVPEQGSTFTLYLPDAYPGAGAAARAGAADRAAGPRAEAPAPQPSGGREPLVDDDRDAVGEKDSTLLIVEDDAAFAKILLELAREKGFKGIVAGTAAEGMELARRFKPDAVTLDILLPDGDGWSVLAALKRDPDLRHIPVDVISVDPDPARARQRGAYRVLAKPATRKDLAQALAEMRAFAGRETRDLLIVAGSEAARKKVIQLIGNGDVKMKEAASGKAALAALKRTRYDCVLIEPDLPDMDASGLVAALRSDPRLEMTPIVVFAPKDPAKSEAEALEKLASDGALRQVKSPERLLDETSLFLHRVLAGLPAAKRRLVQAAQTAEAGLAGKKVLVVDDDMRNIYALTGALESHKLVVLSADDGKSALRALEDTPGVDLVLMDIMMPEMDGYETMRRIRALKKFERLPIIALTAKAMIGDREKCIEAGASDYVSKPVDVDQLLSLMRVWLSK